MKPNDIFYGVVAERDGFTSGEPIIFECYLQENSEQAAEKFRKSLGNKYGKTFVAKITILGDTPKPSKWMDMQESKGGL